MPQSPFSDAVIAAAVQKLPDLPPEQVNLGMEANASDTGVELTANKRLGKGWVAEADASWWQKAGWKAAAWIGWKGKP